MAKLTPKELENILNKHKDTVKIPVKVYETPVEKPILNRKYDEKALINKLNSKEHDELLGGIIGSLEHKDRETGNPKAADTFEKLSKEDQKDIKDSLEATRKMLNKKVDEFDCFLDNNESFLSNDIFDVDLIDKWKKHVEKVNKWIEHHKGFPAPIAKALLLEDYGTPAENENLSPNEKAFKKITDKMFTTYQKKNKDYGSSFDELFDEFGMTSALLRLKDKYNRLKSITENGKIEVKDESVEDTLLDMANYAILTVLKLRTDKK